MKPMRISQRPKCVDNEWLDYYRKGNVRQERVVEGMDARMDARVVSVAQTPVKFHTSQFGGKILFSFRVIP